MYELSHQTTMTMSTITLCNRISGKASRSIVKDVNLSDTISIFRAKASQLIDVPSRDIELIYSGECLKDDRTLESYGLHQNSTVHALKKVVRDDDDDMAAESMDSAAVQQVVTALQAALLNPAHRSVVENMMSRPETIENLVAATPGLDRDPVALAMLQDSELLAVLADPDNIQKVIDAHPSLGHAAMMVAAAINEEASKTTTRTGSGSSRATYSLDQMSDDEDMGGPSVIRQPAQPITASQLAAALAVAGGGNQDNQAPASGGSSSSAPPGGSISADFFRQAMMQATGQVPSTVTPQVSDAALQQLRDMGITDEVRARRALEVTGGNIQAALELLFGDSEL